MNWDACYKTGLGDTFSGVAPLSCLPPLVANLTYWAFVFAGVIAVFFIIYAGFLYVRSGGDAKQVQAARATLTYAIIGLIIVLSSVFILNVISRVTGIGCLRSFGFTSCQTESDTTRKGQFACFYKPGWGQASCYEYSENNDPKEPIGAWYTNYTGCQKNCRKPE